MTALQTILTVILGLGMYAGATWLPVTMQIHDTLIEAARYLVGLALAQHINPLPLRSGTAMPAGKPSAWSKIFTSFKKWLISQLETEPFSYSSKEVSTAPAAGPAPTSPAATQPGGSTQAPATTESKFK